MGPNQLNKGSRKSRHVGLSKPTSKNIRHLGHLLAEEMDFGAQGCRVPQAYLDAHISLSVSLAGLMIVLVGHQFFMPVCE